LPNQKKRGDSKKIWYVEKSAKWSFQRTRENKKNTKKGAIGEKKAAR